MDASRAEGFELIGGHPLLDFVNTVGGKRVVKPREELRRLEDVLVWGQLAGVLSQSEAQALRQQAAARPAKAEEALRRAVDFRESLYRLLLALVEARPVPPGEVARLEAEVQRALAARRLRCTEEGCVWSPPDVSLLDSVIPRLALAAAELLTSERWRRVRVCEATRDDGCGWLFLDQTRNHSRRWCDMALCGNKHKARRHYARVRAEG
ncbi:MAG: CGNR zinc finger domain-containing protein [Myxococcaceae bacterium]